MLMQIIAVLMVLILLYFVVMGVTGNKLGFLFSGTPDSGSKAAGFNNVEQVFLRQSSACSVMSRGRTAQ
jgi:nucleoside permease NupC